MKRVFVVAMALALLCAAGVFAADLSIGAEVPLGMTYYDHPDLSDSVNGFGYGGRFVFDVKFTPQIAAEFKLGLVVDSYTFKDFGYDYDERDQYIDFVGLFKFYVSPTIFLGAGVEYFHFNHMDVDDNVSGLSFSIDRSDLTSTKDIDPVFVLVAAGVELAVAPSLSVPIAANFGYGVMNIPSKVTKMLIYGTIGIRYKL
jgi:hypothetical protein